MEYWREWEQEDINRVYGVDRKTEVKKKILEAEKGRKMGAPTEDWKGKTILELEKRGTLGKEEIDQIKDVLVEHHDVFEPAGEHLPAMQGEEMEIRLMDGGGRSRDKVGDIGWGKWTVWY